jgi:hypothetical protein
MRSGSFQSTTLIAVAMLLLILFVSAGYVMLIPAADESSANHQLSADLQRNRERWESMRPASFRYVVDRSCFCAAEVAAPYVATEERGFKQVSFRAEVESSTGEFLAAPSHPAWIDTIFDELAAAIAAEHKPAIEVRYDSHYGYPVTVTIRQPTPDAYITYDIQDFEVLEYREE